jgi:hypothetical protein
VPPVVQIMFKEAALPVIYLGKTFTFIASSLEIFLWYSCPGAGACSPCFALSAAEADDSGRPVLLSATAPCWSVPALSRSVSWSAAASLRRLLRCM